MILEFELMSEFFFSFIDFSAIRQVLRTAQRICEEGAMKYARLNSIFVALTFKRMIFAKVQLHSYI